MSIEFEATKQPYPFLEGGGEMGALIREYDWSQTAIGPVAEWPAALRTMVGVILHSKFPMFLWWGDELIQLYNDAYRPSLGKDAKHPKALGQRAEDCWPEIWDDIYPLINQVKTTNQSFFIENQLLPIYRNGHMEDVYWTYSYSSVIGESGKIEGVLVVCNETTEHVQAIRRMESLKNKHATEESNLRNIIHQAPVAMCIFRGEDFEVEITNDKMLELWGTERDLVLNKPIFEGLPEARDQGFEKILRDVYNTGETFQAFRQPVNLPRPGGIQTIFINYVYEALKDEEGEISGIMAVAIDVTEAEIARKKLEENETLLRSVVESAPFPIGVYTGREMRIKLLNQAIIDVWDKGSDIVGKLYSEVLPELENQQIYPQLEGVYDTGKPFHARNQRVDLVVDGRLQTYYFNYSFTPLFDQEGNVFGVMNTAADVTDLNIAKQKVEQSERNFRNMVKQAPVAMCIMIGPDHIVDVANDQFLTIWNKTEEEVLNKPIFQEIPSLHSQDLQSLLSRVYEQGESYTANERPVTYLRHGKPVTGYQNFVYEPYKDAHGNVLGILTIATDVTEQVIARHKIEDIVAERTLDLQKSNDELTQFAYITSHDLQEPARKIKTFSEMLEKRLGNEIDDKSALYVDKIKNSSERMLTLIRDVLGISQLSEERKQFSRVSLENILDETLGDFELMIEQQQVNIRRDSLPEISAIPIQMRQLFGNLISNAFKFSKKDEALELHITSRELEKNVPLKTELKPGRQYVQLKFKDNGIGFNQNNAEQIFNIFQRLHGKSEYQGTGIGLAMCKKIVENHSGYIYAESSPGEGAAFYVILPV